MDLIVSCGIGGSSFVAKSNLRCHQQLKGWSFNTKESSSTYNRLITSHSMPQKKEIFDSMESWAKANVLTLLKPVETCWHPHDLLPQSSSDTFLDQVRDLRHLAGEIPDEYFVVLVGDMITEEALPTYQSLLNGYDGIRDDTGSSQSPWAIWIRAWSAEENRHGDLLNRYLYLSGRVDMKSVEKTTQYLIGSGMDIQTDNNPYLGFIYTSFQERATFISHSNTAKLAHGYGDTNLAKICGFISSDEKRHETAYTRVVGKLFEIDPDETMLAFAAMMKKKITMPAHMMYDGQDEELFNHFSAVAQRLGVYTAMDYADIVEFLVKKWEVEKLCGLSGQGKEAQEYVCGLGPRFRRLAERAESRSRSRTTLIPFSWIFKREVEV